LKMLFGVELWCSSLHDVSIEQLILYMNGWLKSMTRVSRRKLQYFVIKLTSQVLPVASREET
jgi:hypothetical protein